jgi:uncharacterized membrane protein
LKKVFWRYNLNIKEGMRRLAIAFLIIGTILGISFYEIGGWEISLITFFTFLGVAWIINGFSK